MQVGLMSVNDQRYEDAYRDWRTSLTTLLADPPLLARWQERRYQFAHRVGTLRDCRLKGDGVHHAMLGIARLHNLALTG